MMFSSGVVINPADNIRIGGRVSDWMVYDGVSVWRILKTGKSLRERKPN